MLIHWILFILLLYFTLQNFEVKSCNYNLYVNLCFLYIFMMYTLRSYCVGTDTYGYISSFASLENNDFSFIINNYRDPTFYLIIKSIKYLSHYNIFIFFFIAITFVSSFSYTLRKQSENVFFSLLILMLFRYIDFPLNAMRNGIAVSVAFFSLNFLISKKYKKFIMVVILASLFHKSLLIYLILLPLSFLKLEKMHKKAILFYILIFALLLEPIYKNFLVYLFVDQYAIYKDSTDNSSKILTLLIVSLFYIIVYVNMSFKSDTDSRDKIAFISCTLSLICSLMALQNPILGRMSLIFGLPFTWLVPNLLKKHREFVDDALKRVLVTSVFLIIYILGGPAPGVIPYSFFWNPKLNITHLQTDSRSEFSNFQELPILP